MLQAQAEVSKAQSIFLLKDTSAVLKREETEAPQVQVEVSEVNSVFLSQGCEHRQCKRETTSVAHEGLPVRSEVQQTEVQSHK